VHFLSSSSISFLFKKWWTSLALLGGSGHLGSGGGDDLEGRAGSTELCGGLVRPRRRSPSHGQQPRRWPGSTHAAVYRFAKCVYVVIEGPDLLCALVQHQPFVHQIYSLLFQDTRNSNAAKRLLEIINCSLD
jgi:hypothetical protein